VSSSQAGNPRIVMAGESDQVDTEVEVRSRSSALIGIATSPSRRRLRDQLPSAEAARSTGKH
jgi:hypothetical protein